MQTKEVVFLSLFKKSGTIKILKKMLTTVCYMPLRTYGILTSCVCGFVSVLGAVISSVVLYSGAIDKAFSLLTSFTSVCTVLNIATFEKECSFMKELQVTHLRTGKI